MPMSPPCISTGVLKNSVHENPDHAPPPKMINGRPLNQVSQFLVPHWILYGTNRRKHGTLFTNYKTCACHEITHNLAADTHVLMK